AHVAVRWVPAAAWLLLVCGAKPNVDRVRAWISGAWPGVDADEVRVVDFIGHRLHGKANPEIGYEIYFAKWMAALHAVDERYKVGAEMDVLFQYQARVHNADRCAEGIDRDDDYRIIETESPG